MTDPIKAAIEASRERDNDENGDLYIQTMGPRFREALAVAMETFAKFDNFEADSLIGLIIRDGYTRIAAILEWKP